VGTAPPQLVSIAAEAGFDFIGARVRPVTATERPYDLQPGSPMLKETIARMQDTGVTVEDIEFLLLDGTDQRAAWLQMLEAGQALGARTMTVACADPDASRFADTLAQLSQDGRGFGILPTLEPISYQVVRSIPDAAERAGQAGVGIVVDSLHFHRFGGTLEELKACTSLVPLLQLCDGPVASPASHAGLVLESRSERQVPGEGEFDLASLVAAFPADLPVSVETPSERRVTELGEAGWARMLKTGVDAVLAPAAGRQKAGTR
jgi:sugar phosphate isomerase/epimerase